MTTTTDQSQPVIHPAPPPARPLRRRPNRVLAGVAGGLADYLGAPVGLIRALFVIGAVMGGAGIPVYLVLWLIVPTADVDHGVLDRWLAPRSD